MSPDDASDDGALHLLEDALRKTMTAASGDAVDDGLADLGWLDLLDEMPDTAIRLVFSLLGETGAHASVLNDVILRAAGREAGGTVPMPFAGGSWVNWERTDLAGGTLGGDLPLHRVPGGTAVPLAAGRRAVGWWLVGTGRAMLALARRHAVDRVQFGKPIASFQAIRHRLAETLVAIEGAEATLAATITPSVKSGSRSRVEGEPNFTLDEEELASSLAKAAAGQAALTAARHCQQVLGGIGFTAEHDLHRHVERALVLDCLLGSSRELTREAGALLRAHGSAPRLVDL